MKHRFAQFNSWCSDLWVRAWVRVVTRPPLALVAIVLGILTAPQTASAGLFSGGSASSVPWLVTPLCTIATALDGPIARIAVVIAIAFFGILMMVGELKGIFGTASRLLLGAAIALGAAQWLGLFSSSTSSGSGSCGSLGI